MFGLFQSVCSTEDLNKVDKQITQFKYSDNMCNVPSIYIFTIINFGAAFFELKK